MRPPGRGRLGPVDAPQAVITRTSAGAVELARELEAACRLRQGRPPGHRYPQPANRRLVERTRRPAGRRRRTWW